MTTDPFTRKRLAPSQWALVDDLGREVGRYGGRAGDRWAEDLVHGVTVTEDSPLSAGTVRSLLESSIVTCSNCGSTLTTYANREGRPYRCLDCGKYQNA